MQQRNQFERNNMHASQNFVQPQAVCSFFQKDQCKLQGCKREHKYELCPDYDKGFCYRGSECPKKHIVRKICFDYLYGFCKDGPDCKMNHVKLFQNREIKNELKFTEQFYKLLKETGVYADFPDFKPVICNACTEIGHKSNVCKKQSRVSARISPTKMILCGICSQEHQIQQQGKLPNCKYLQLQQRVKEIKTEEV